MDASTVTGWLVNGAIVVGIVVGLALLYFHLKGVTPAQGVAAIQGNPQVQAIEKRLADMERWAASEFTKLWNKPAVESAAMPTTPIIGQSFADVWDAAFSVAALQNSVVIDGELVRSGTQPTITFKTVAPVSPSTKTSVVRES